ncbi:type VI secretion system accessory protein TagJ, partial [Roseomonas rosulenta]|uniref:type VI secretion system accessory protein TagJ n=1 Tax=Roseomonas rosulenta TaxID=2748667 RepID=UPI00272C3B9F
AAEVEALRPRVTGRAGDLAFDDFRDADDVFAAMIEVHTAGGEYMWVPTERLRALSFDAPKRPRDLYWRRCTIEMKDGQEGVVYIPVVYPWTAKDMPNPLRLGRGTEWQEDGTLVRGLGGREFLVGEEAKTLAELDELMFD